jgi:hypothetical protein
MYASIQPEIEPRLVVVIFASTIFALTYSRASFPQIPKDLPPDVAVELARSPKPPLPNQVVGIDIDRFVGTHSCLRYE